MSRRWSGFHDGPGNTREDLKKAIRHEQNKDRLKRAEKERRNADKQQRKDGKK